MNANNTANSSEGRKGEDLQTIKGIGPGYAGLLHAADVHHLADLARYNTPTELQLAIEQNAGVEVPLWKIESDDWIGQARRLVEERVSTGTAEEAETEVTTGENWRQHAGFSVFFDYAETEGDPLRQSRKWQTRDYHDESGEEKVFSGVEPGPWVNWILKRADLGGTWAGSETELTFKVPDESQTRVEILSIEVHESQPTYGIFRGELAADVHIKVKPDPSDPIAAADTTFRTEIYLVEEESLFTQCVASAEPALKPDESDYRVSMEFPFPEAGRYQLHCVVILKPPINEMAVFHESILNIRE